MTFQSKQNNSIGVKIKKKLTEGMNEPYIKINIFNLIFEKMTVV